MGARVTTLAVMVTLGTASPAAAEAWAPWDNPSAGALPAEAYHAPEALAVASAGTSKPLQLALRAYQIIFSSQDAGSCPMYPSCSRFAMVAIHRHGPVQGVLMTASRLLREGGAISERHRRVQVGDRRLFWDPPEDHRLW